MEVDGMTVDVVNSDDYTCSVHRPGGREFHRRSLPDAPFLMCLEHAAELMAFIQDQMPAQPKVVEALAAAEQYCDPGRQTIDRRDIAPGEGVNVIYYVRIDGLIKIGYSTNLALRVRQFPPHTELLAYEPGNLNLETHRHRQFHRYHAMRREWFHQGPLLNEHITRLRGDLPALAA